MSPIITNTPAPGVSFYTPLQDPPAGTAINPQSNGKSIPTLFQPIKIRGVQFPNRIFLSPLCQYSAKDGFVTPWHLAHLGGIFTQGPGVSIMEATGVLPEGRISPQDVGLWSDAHLEALKPIVEFAHSQNQKIGIQLAHAGRKASTMAAWIGGVASKEADGWPDNIWGPSPIPFSNANPVPKELTTEGIKRVVKAFADAAKRAVEAGFDVIEVHNAHGYLLQTFLSPNSNKRTDEYGGSFENRIRFTLEVVDAIRAVIPETMPFFLRVSGTDWLEEVLPDEPSWKVEDTARLAPILAAHGVDLMDVSAGGNDSRQKIRSGPLYQVQFAAAAKKAAAGTSLLVSAVGGLRKGELAQGVLDKGDADIIFVGRQFQQNPGTVFAMANDLGVEIQQPHQIGWGLKGRGKTLLGSNTKL